MEPERPRADLEVGAGDRAPGAGAQGDAAHAQRPGPAAGGPDGRADARDRAEILRLSEEVLPALAARLGASGLGEIEVRGAGWHVRLRRRPATAALDGAGATHGHSGGPTGHAAPGALGAAARGGPVDERAPGEGLARSPAVGYFSPRTDLVVGLPVRAGDPLGHVEVLGLRQEVPSPSDGIVGHVLVEPGQAVEYGQELIRVDALRRPGGAA